MRLTTSLLASQLLALFSLTSAVESTRGVPGRTTGNPHAAQLTVYKICDKFTGGVGPNGGQMRACLPAGKGGGVEKTRWDFEIENTGSQQIKLEGEACEILKPIIDTCGEKGGEMQVAV